MGEVPVPGMRAELGGKVLSDIRVEEVPRRKGEDRSGGGGRTGGSVETAVHCHEQLHYGHPYRDSLCPIGQLGNNNLQLLNTTGKEDLLC